MPRKTATIVAYADVEAIFDAALQNKGITHVCANESAAKNLVNRLCSYRMLDRGDHEDSQSIYDKLVVRRRDNKVIVEPRPDVFPGETFTLDGRPVDLQPIIEQNKRLAEYQWRERYGGHKPFDPDKPLDI